MKTYNTWYETTTGNQDSQDHATPYLAMREARQLEHASHVNVVSVTVQVDHTLITTLHLWSRV